MSHLNLLPTKLHVFFSIALAFKYPGTIEPEQLHELATTSSGPYCSSG